MGARLRQPRERAIRIVLASSGSGSRGGGEIFLDYLGRGLAGRGHEVISWIPEHPRMDELAAKCARFSRVVRARYRNTYDYRARSLATCFTQGVSREVAGEWKALDPDVVHLNKQNLEDGLDLLRAAGDCGVPSVCTIHLTQTARYLRARAPGLRDWISRRALAGYPGILVAVQSARQAALDAFLGGRVRTRMVFNGVPLVDREALRAVRERQRAALGVGERDFLVIGLGRLVEQKRPMVFLETARELLRSRPAARFVWVGDGNLVAQWNEWVAREGLGSAISCVGWQADTQPFLLAADLLLHVAAYEGLPLAVIEAMAAGLPCAVTRELAIEVPLFDERVVVFFETAAGLAAQLDPEALAGIARNARRLAEERFSEAAMVDAYERLYREAGQA